MRHFKKLVVSIPSLAIVLGVMVSSIAFADMSDQITLILSNRHMKTTPAELEKIAGGPDNLVKTLLAIRQDEKLIPWVPLRAEKILLRYADRDEVQTALLEDLSSPHLKGLARIITIHVDEVSSPEVRRKLARASLERAKGDSEFMPYAHSLQKSSDAEISRMAREAAAAQN